MLHCMHTSQLCSNQVFVRVQNGENRDEIPQIRPICVGTMLMGPKREVQHQALPCPSNRNQYTYAYRVM